MTQEEFETLLGRGEYPNETVPSFTVIYFTATWCGACRALDMPALEAAHPNVNWLKCDVDQNTYTPGYCSIRAIPSFVAIKDKIFVGSFQSTKNENVSKWINETLLIK